MARKIRVSSIITIFYKRILLIILLLVSVTGIILYLTNIISDIEPFIIPTLLYGIFWVLIFRRYKTDVFFDEQNGIITIDDEVVLLKDILSFKKILFDYYIVYKRGEEVVSCITMAEMHFIFLEYPSVYIKIKNNLNLHKT